MVMKKYHLLFLFCFLLCLSNAFATKILKSLSSQYGFIENKGQIIDQTNQANSSVKFLFTIPGLNVQLKANSFSYDTYTATVRKRKAAENAKYVLPNENDEEFDVDYKFHRIDIEFIGANPNPKLKSESPFTDYLNYQTTGVPEVGINNVRHFAKITYLDLYPNIDLEFISKQGTSKPVEYNFIIHPGADISQIKWRYKGSNSIKLVNDKIQIVSSNGNLTESIPHSFEKESGKTVNVNYKDLGTGVFAFEASEYDLKATLIIDPLPDLKWATYYGDAVIDYGYGISTDAAGNMYVTGATTSTTNIATSGAYQTTMAGLAGYGSGGDVFIVKFDAQGARVWGTYYGGANNEMGLSIKVDNSGNIYIWGTTSSPTGIATTTGMFQSTIGSTTYNDPFLAKFSNSGSRIWATYFGGTGNDRAYQNGMVLDSAGNIYVTGTNNTPNNTWITSPGAYQTTNLSTSSYDEPFAAKFDPSGARIWGTYYGGTLHDIATCIALDASNNVIIAGYCTSTSLIATSGAHQTTWGGGTSDAFVAKLNSTGTALIWASYYGGSLADVATGVAVDASGNVFLSGYTASTSAIATTGSYMSTFGGGTYDGFLVKFNSTGTRQWATYYGGSADDIPRTGNIDIYGNMFIGGDAVSTSGIATPGAYQTTFAGGTRDAFVAKFNTSGIPQWGTYFGGALEDLAWSIVIEKGNIYMAGRTVSTSGIATSGAFQTTYGGGTYDAFFAKFAEQGPANNASVSALVSPTKFCAGNQDIKVRIKNNGINQIDSVIVNWELDAIPQSPIMWRSTLDTIGGLLRNDTVVTLATSLNFIQNIPKTIRVWTSMPNNSIDTTNNDDSIFVTIKPALVGSYVLDPFFGDYNTFSSAVNDLNRYGNCGPVVFNVTPGASFTESPIILSNSGTATDSIVFQKAYFGPNPVIYGVNGTGTLDAVITLNGASYITFDGIDVADSSSNTSAATQMEFGYGISNLSATVGASNNRIKNCKVTLNRVNLNTIGIAQSTMSAALSLLGANHNNRFENIRIENSYNGILLSGTAAFPDSNNIITSSGIDSTIIGGTNANDIGNGTAIVYGIQAVNQKNIEISKTTVRNLTHTGTLLPSGIWLNNISTAADCGKARIFNNIISGLSRTSATATGGITGIRIDVVPNATAVVYNNLIFGLSTANPSAASATMLLRGIAQGVSASNGSAEYYHNSVYINSSSANGSYAAFWRAGTGSSTYRNNIFSCVIPAQSGVAKHYAAYISSGIVANSSNNILWAPNANGFVGYASLDRNSLPLYAAAISATAPADGNESGSANADPNFAGINDLNFLSSTPAQGSGVAISNPTISYDILGAIRNNSTPTIGAIETGQTQIDSSAPVIRNVIINNGSTPSVFADIKDNSNVYSAGDVKLWYRAGSSGSFIGVYPDSVPSSSINGTYKWSSVFNSLLVGSYQFYIAARDLTGQGLNIAVNPIQSLSFTGFNISDPVNYASNPDVAANTRTFAKTTSLAGGTYTVGPTGNYLKLTNVANALNTNAITGNVIFELQSTYDGTTGETFPIVFNQLMTSGGEWKATIRPSSGATARVTSGDPGSANPLIRFNGTNRLTFDGRPGGIGSNIEWTIRNTRTAATVSSVFSFINDAVFDTLQYLKIESQNSAITSGTIEFLGTNLTQGNDNNVIRYNEIRDRSDATGLPAMAIYSSGTAMAENDSNIIDNNKIYNWTNSGILVSSMGNGSGWKITNNSFYSTTTTSTAQTAIRFEAGAGFASIKNKISGNFIGGNAPNAAGSAWVNSVSGTWRGIACITGITDSSYIQNNTIQNIILTGGTGTFSGIESYGGLLSFRGNTIGHNSSSNSIQTSQLGSINSLWINGSSNISQVYDNIIANINSIGTSNAVVNNGILVSSSASNYALRIRNNLVHDMASTANTSVSGISISNTTAMGNISANKIYALKNTGTSNTALISGINLDLAQAINVFNNFVSLGLNVDSSAMIAGIRDNSSATGNNIYYNTVLITGNATSPSAISSQAYRRSASSTTNLRNNIFKNIRTGSGSHFAVANAISTPTMGWKANYNDLYATNSAQIGLWNTTTTTFSAWKSISLNDTASINYSPVFVSTNDLHLSGASVGNWILAGKSISGYTADIDGQTRHTVYPYIGADEASTPLPVKLIVLSANKVKDDILVAWQTASEMNSDRFEVERLGSALEAEWTTIGKVKAAGNSNSLRNYQFSDDKFAQLQNSQTIFYRLKIVDYDGSFEYSNIVSVSNESNNQESVFIYPNPFFENLIIKVNCLEAINAYVEVKDISGRILFEKLIQVQNGLLLQSIESLADLNEGVYFISVVIKGKLHVQKVIKL